MKSTEVNPIQNNREHLFSRNERVIPERELGRSEQGITVLQTRRQSEVSKQLDTLHGEDDAYAK